MDSLKLFMQKNAYKFVYAYLTAPWLGGDGTSFFLFGEIPFPTQEYMDIKNRMK